MIKDFNATTIPSDILAFCSNPNLRGIREDFSIPRFEFGRTYYMTVLGTKYKTIRIDRVFFRGCEGYMRAFIIFHTPDGTKYCKQLEPRRIDIFMDIENYKEYCKTGKGTTDIEEVYVKGYYFEEVYNRISNYETHLHEILFQKYNWVNGRVASQVMPIDWMWIDEDGAHMTFQNTDGFYETEQECLDANFSVEEFEFEEDKPKPQVFKVSVTIEVVATTMEDAERIAKEKVGCITE